MDGLTDWHVVWSCEGHSGGVTSVRRCARMWPGNCRSSSAKSNWASVTAPVHDLVRRLKRG
jgi:hypothetical protein